MARSVYLRSIAPLSASPTQPRRTPPLAAAELPPRALPEAGWIEPIPRPTGARVPRFGRLDRLAQLGMVAASSALRASQQGAAPSWDLRPLVPPAGIALGTCYGAHLSNELYWRGLRGGTPSPALFPYTLPSGAAAEISMGLGLTGPSLTITGAMDAGLAALAAAASCLASGQASLMLAGAVDVLSPSLLLARTGQAVELDEGAVFTVLTTAAEGSLARLAGVGQANGEGALDRAASAALEQAAVRPDQLHLRLEPERGPGAAQDCVRYHEGHGLAAAPLLACVDSLQSGALPLMVVAGSEGVQASATALCWIEAR